MTIEIRLLTTAHEFTACEKIQEVIWGSFGIVPDHLLITIQKNGGLVLGAFDHATPDSPMVGFVFGFLGRTRDGRLKHTSHMAAVLPAYRDAGIGAQLKWAQRDYALAQGLDLMTWTFIPLLSRNAQLNMTRLGAVCRTYIRNCYGPEPDLTTAELPSDRFQVDWWLRDERVASRRTGSALLPNTTILRAQALLVNPDPREPVQSVAHGEAFLLQIPSDLDALRAVDPARACAWSYQVRTVAEPAFATGYQITAFARDGAVGLYLLEQAS